MYEFLIDFEVVRILKIWYFSKLLNLKNLMIFEIVKFLNFFKLQIFLISQIGNIWNFGIANC